MCCGWNNEYLKDCWSFHFKTRKWEKLPDVPETSTAARSYVYKDYFFVRGGYSLNHNNHIFKLDLLTNNWTQIVTSNTAGDNDKRTAHCFFVFNDNFYVYGGYNS